MQRAPLAVGVALGLGTVLLLAGVLRHPGRATAPSDHTADHTSASIVACSSPDACMVAERTPSNERLPVLPWRIAIDETPTSAVGAFAPLDLALADQLPPNELVTFPGREHPIERYKALHYFCPGDFNRDDVVDQRDITDYLEASATMSGPLAQFLDINHDGVVDASDLQALIDASFADCDAAQMAMSRSLICLADPEDQEVFARVVFFVDDGC